MAEAEQRHRLAIEQHESVVATDLAKREMSLQEVQITGRLSLERTGMRSGFWLTVFLFVGALAYGYFVPEQSVAALLLACLPGAASLINAFRAKQHPSAKQEPASTPKPPPTPAKRKRK